MLDKYGINLSKRVVTYGIISLIVTLFLIFEGIASIFSYGKGTTFPIILLITFLIIGFFCGFIRDWIQQETKQLQSLYDNIDLLLEDAKVQAIQDFGEEIGDKTAYVDKVKEIINAKQNELNKRAERFIFLENENGELANEIEQMSLQIMNFNRLFQLKKSNQNEENVCFDLGFLNMNRVVFVQKMGSDNEYPFYFYERKEGLIFIGEAVFNKRLHSSDTPNLAQDSEVSTYVCSDLKVKIIGSFELDSLPISYKSSFILGTMQANNLTLIAKQLKSA